jgi:hypothetical protein
VRQHASHDQAASPQAETPDRVSRVQRGAVTGPPTQAQALALQRLAGNRATAATLARWAAHPDPAKKGQMVPDVVAAEFLRFNPPKNS